MLLLKKPYQFVHAYGRISDVRGDTDIEREK